MKESDSERQECGEQSDYKEATRFLSSEVIHREKEDATTLLSQLGYDLNHERFVSQEQIEETTLALARAIEAVQVVAKAQPGTEPMPAYRPTRFSDRKDKAEPLDERGATGE